MTSKIQNRNLRLLNSVVEYRIPNPKVKRSSRLGVIFWTADPLSCERNFIQQGRFEQAAGFMRQSLKCRHASLQASHCSWRTTKKSKDLQQLSPRMSCGRLGSADMDLYRLRFSPCIAALLESTDDSFDEKSWTRLIPNGGPSGKDSSGRPQVMLSCPAWHPDITICLTPSHVNANGRCVGSKAHRNIQEGRQAIPGRQRTRNTSCIGF